MTRYFHISWINPMICYSNYRKLGWYAPSCENVFSHFLCFPVILWQSAFSSFTQPTETLSFVQLDFHRSGLITAFCESLFFWVSQIWRQSLHSVTIQFWRVSQIRPHHCILWQSSFDEFHRLGLVPVSSDNLTDDCHWRLGNILFATGCCHRTRVVPFICDKF